MSRTFLKIPRNLFASGVSILVLVVMLVGSAFAERAPIEQQRGYPSKHRLNTPPPRHDTKFKQIPDTKLEIRAIQYDGSTNGTLTVQVKNPTNAPLKFSATGLYFVPEGDPDQAPQRLGAVGPMQLATGPSDETMEMAIAPGKTVELNLDVFCIDSHRSSPTPQNVFNIGATRMPKQLSRTIEQRANIAVDEAKSHGASRPAAKHKIQGEVWRSRDANWVELDGEGKQEVSKKKR